MSLSPASNILVIAHRGFRGIAPENTLLAAQRAFEAGAEWWELDVAASSDEVLVVLHDDNLARTTDAKKRFPDRSPWCVYDFSLADLKSLDAWSWYTASDPFKQIAAGRLGAADLAAFEGLRMPTLREALELTRSNGRKVNVEIKDATGRACDGWIAERVVELVRELDMVDDVLISSFNHAYLRRVKKAESRIEIGALVESRPSGLVPLLRELEARSYHPGLKGLDADTVREVREAGFDVFVWTCNEEEDMDRLIAWGVNGIITDFPDRCLRILGR